MTCANHPDREHVAFCQNCGKPLCKECSRIIGQAVFCEPCLAARLAGVSGAAGYPSAPNPEGTVPLSDPGLPSPLLATLLGVIPGVGAMYNGQYAKGIVHLVVFAVLISLANNVNGLFGLFIAGWIIYQIIDANHTARARLAGTPMPNPFGLNDIGDRLGFGRSWPAAAPYPPAAAPPPPTTPPPPPPTGAASAPPADPYAPFTQPASNWGAPPERYSYVPPTSAPHYTGPYPPDDPSAYVRPVHNQFPAGAIWLIGLGAFFLAANMFRHFPLHLFTPFIVIGAGVWLFFRRMLSSGPTLTDDGSAMYRYRLISALRSSVWVILVGVMFLLATFTRFLWNRSWPLFIIVAGVMALLQRSTLIAAHTSYPYPPNPPPPEPATPSATSTSIVPVNPIHDEARGDQLEGR